MSLTRETVSPAATSDLLGVTDGGRSSLPIIAILIPARQASADLGEGADGEGAHAGDLGWDGCEGETFVG